jgi:hypothetical protein
MRAKLNLDDKMVEEALKLDNVKAKEKALSAALTDFVQRHNRLRILELADKTHYDPVWDYKKMRDERRKTVGGRRRLERAGRVCSLEEFAAALGADVGGRMSI